MGFSTNPAGKLHILWHDCNAFGVNSAQVGVFEHPNKVGFGSFLTSEESGALEPQVLLEILGDLTNYAHEGFSADEQIGRLLIFTNLTKAHGSRTVSMGLLDTGAWGGLAGSLRGELLARRLSSCGSASSLLGTSHGFVVVCCGASCEKNCEVANLFVAARSLFVFSTDSYKTKRLFPA